MKTIAEGRRLHIREYSQSLVLLFALFLVFTPGMRKVIAQTSSGTISGRVVDATGGVVLGADVRLINDLTGNVVTARVQSDGGFVFPDVQPGTYTVDVRANGYKELLKRGLVLSSAERLSAGALILQVGSVSQSVTVSAATTPVQTQSAEVSGLLDTKQLDNLLAVGRDFMSMVRTIPGVVGGGAGSLGTSGTPTINGIRNVNNSGTIDGVSGSPRGGDKIDTPPNLDAIQEVKVLTSNYQAEYGAGTAGPVINLVTKSGTRNFHGTAYYYVRNEAFNANDWFNNYNNVPRPQYRYNTVGGNIGGPIYWPGHFNTARNKLFFFYSQEYWPDKSPEGLKKYMVPTALERAGDFSQTPSQGRVNPDPNKDYLNIKKPGADPSTCPATG
ncbi:MAG TPA: TonB-dependent receptor, partial [Ktedonobacteraceae bacterium]